MKSGQLHIDASRHLHDEAVERLHFAHAERFVLDLEKRFFRVHETRSKVELVVRTRGKTPNVRDPIARNPNFAFAPMKQVAAIEIAHEAPCVKRFSRNIL